PSNARNAGKLLTSKFNASETQYERRELLKNLLVDQRPLSRYFQVYLRPNFLQFSSISFLAL
ncbi:MAG: hypothetical protein IJS52_06190, partial [Bacilli bacterium]|nr:hypothetical protein [Bacilli bacterium]